MVEVLTKIIGTTLLFLFGTSIVLGIVFSILDQVAFYYSPPLAKFLATIDLQYSCALGKESGCNELRPIPKILQNKKIAFSKDIDILFEPFENPNYITRSDLDTLGTLDTDNTDDKTWEKNIVDPALRKRGYLSEREYNIVRTQYHYNCYLCIDSDDYADIVVEDRHGNRFVVFLRDWDDTISSNQLPWDEWRPFFYQEEGVFFIENNKN